MYSNLTAEFSAQDLALNRQTIYVQDIGDRRTKTQI